MDLNGDDYAPKYVPDDSEEEASPQLGHFRLPDIQNEPMLNYAPGSVERKKLQDALATARLDLKTKGPYNVPAIVNGVHVTSGKQNTQAMPFDHQSILCSYHEADRATVAKMMAATMLGQGKNAWQAEIDAAAELCDFWRFNTLYAADIYAQQPSKNSALTWNRSEYRPLEGFVVAYSPFNFTAIGGNLPSAPALMGNVVLWKPSNTSIYSNYLIMEILHEAGLPEGVIQFIPGDAEMVTETTFSHPEFAGLHFTGSTAVFKMLWKKIADNIEIYKSYPRIVGETGGKNMHFIHKSADAKHTAMQTFYVPDNLWNDFRENIIAETKKLKSGPVDDFTNFVSAVINKQIPDNIAAGNDSTSSILVGGKTSDEKGYYIEPTVIVTTDPKAKTMQYEQTLLLTAALFARDREAIIIGSNKLRNAAGNFYINDKSTGAVVGQQPFGGSRASGTNDKAGSAL
ncbi:Aldehyde/histidinol dehydrogenase [Chytridium lagenaria]|nr:Aldehyde/histidinol dehydrogenase [Chytridium lagenaria]